ncbi:TetR/AcrR family transcriptional regulator [Nocardia rhamnosiphila]|uniref:TetR/AcrR family transcriptional regulator n=1 Tax=Nocardia rhamnosiphila TaxID=426716 RepID=A0ABV2X256_9NOCA
MADLSQHPRRAQILNVSAEIFSSQGYRMATLDDVAEEMGFTRAAVYYYFKSKQEILVALFDQASESLSAQLKKSLTTENGPREKLRSALYGHALVILEQPYVSKVFDTEMAELPREIQLRFLTKEKEYVDQVADVVQQGIDAGEFAHQPPRHAAQAMLGMANSSTKWYRPRSATERTPSKVADMIVALCLDGLLVR